MCEFMKETWTKFLTSSEAVGKLLLKEKRKNHSGVHNYVDNSYHNHFENLTCEKLIRL